MVDSLQRNFHGLLKANDPYVTESYRCFRAWTGLEQTYHKLLEFADHTFKQFSKNVRKV